MTITRITNIDNKKHIALLDTSSISFMQGLEAKGVPSDDILTNIECVWAVKKRKIANILTKTSKKV